MKKISESVFTSWKKHINDTTKCFYHRNVHGTEVLALCFDEGKISEDAPLPLKTVSDCVCSANAPVHAIAFNTVSLVEQIAVIKCESSCETLKFINRLGVDEKFRKECLVPPNYSHDTNDAIFGYVSAEIKKSNITTPNEIYIDGEFSLHWKDKPDEVVAFEKYNIVMGKS